MEYGCEMALKFGLKKTLEWQIGMEYQPWNSPWNISALGNGLEILALEYGLKNSLGNSHITVLKYTLELE